MPVSCNFYLLIRWQLCAVRSVRRNALAPTHATNATLATPATTAKAVRLHPLQSIMNLLSIAFHYLLRFSTNQHNLYPNQPPLIHPCSHQQLFDEQRRLWSQSMQVQRPWLQFLHAPRRSHRCRRRIYRTFTHHPANIRNCGALQASSIQPRSQRLGIR